MHLLKNPWRKCCRNNNITTAHPQNLSIQPISQPTNQPTVQPQKQKYDSFIKDT